MWHRRVSTRYRLWAALSLVLFIAAGCINWVPEGKTAPYWVAWDIFLSGQYGTTPGEFLFVLTAWGLLLAAPSVILGWVGQAAVGVLASHRRGQPSARVADAEPGAAPERGMNDVVQSRRINR